MTRPLPLLLCCVALVSACEADRGRTPAAPAPSSNAAVEAPATEEQLRARITEYVFEPYAAKDYPKLYAKLGERPDPTDRIQAVREGAAFQALRSGRCDHVELAEISDQRTTADNITAFVDCTNGERFYVAESDLAQGSTAVANSQLTLPRANAIQACAEAARAAAAFPSLVDPHVWTGASYTAHKTMGAARVLLDFDATNALGVELPYRANCLFPAGNGTPELTVTPR